MANKAVPGTQFGVKPKTILDFVQTIIKEHKKIAKKSAAHARDCQPNHQTINDAYATAKEQNIDKKALKLAVGAEMARLKYEEERKALEPEQMNMLDYIEQVIEADAEQQAPRTSKVSPSVKSAADRAEERGNITTLHG